MRKKRLYLRYAEKSVASALSAIDAFNRVLDEHRVETTLILKTRAWELLGKALLLKNRISIVQDERGRTLSAEQVISKLQHQLQLLDENQAHHIQQIISLRNEAIHGILPNVPNEILHHLFYFSCKFYKDIITKHFKSYSEKISTNFLSISFEHLTTYCDKVQRLVGRLRKGRKEEKRLVWLLERGIRFDGNEYISQDNFENEWKSKRKKKILPHLEIGKFIKRAEMARIVAIQAPKNYTADVNLRKGPKGDLSLPVQIKKTDIEDDYPYLTREIANKLRKNTNFVSKCISRLSLKGNRELHQKIRSSKSGYINRYSEKALQHLKEFLERNPYFNPYK